MRDWRSMLQQWVAQKSRIAPLTHEHMEYIAWNISSPSAAPWPTHLPTCQALQDFYHLCDGGYFNWFNCFPLARLSRENNYWFKLLNDWDERGDVLLPNQHVVLALDGGGCPVVWNARTDEVRAFQFDGGDWEPPLASSLENFLINLFNPPQQKEDWWYLFLNWLDSSLKE